MNNIIEDPNHLEIETSFPLSLKISVMWEFPPATMEFYHGVTLILLAY